MLILRSSEQRRFRSAACAVVTSVHVWLRTGRHWLAVMTISAIYQSLEVTHGEARLRCVHSWQQAREMISRTVRSVLCGARRRMRHVYLAACKGAEISMDHSSAHYVLLCIASCTSLSCSRWTPQSTQSALGTSSVVQVRISIKPGSVRRRLKFQGRQKRTPLHRPTLFGLLRRSHRCRDILPSYRPSVRLLGR